MKNPLAGMKVSTSLLQTGFLMPAPIPKMRVSLGRGMGVPRVRPKVPKLNLHSVRSLCQFYNRLSSGHVLRARPQFKLYDVYQAYASSFTPMEQRYDLCNGVRLHLSGQIAPLGR